VHRGHTETDDRSGDTMDILPMQVMGTIREHYLLFLGAAGGIGLMAGFVGSWIGAYIGARRAVRSAQLRAPVASEVSRVHLEHLEQLGQMVEAIAIEVERVSEGQRFTTRLLADRMPLSSSPDVRPRGPDLTTPH
jgi:hypothetical protein